MRRQESISDRIIQLVGTAAAGVYALVFGRLDVASMKRREARLAKDVARCWSILLHQKSGQVRQSTLVVRRPSFDYAVIYVDFPTVVFEVTRGRGETRMRLSQATEWPEWEDISSALTLIHPGYVARIQANATLDELCSIVQREWDSLVLVVSESFIAPSES